VFLTFSDLSDVFSQQFFTIVLDIWRLDTLKILDFLKVII
jgi:hypothetical protein